jgi:ABC-type bacteriocin/lantibiotic exporter with double-glycine peptidase domain
LRVAKRQSKILIKQKTAIITNYIYNKLHCISFGLVAIFLLSSCMTIKEIPETGHIHKIDNVPFYPQESYQCGPASLAGVLNYWKVSVAPDEIAKEIFSKSVQGTLTIDMVLYAQKRGLNAIQYKGTIEDIKRNVDYGYPVIVLVDHGISLFQLNHFMVVIGYNGKGIVVNSGKYNDKVIGEQDFLKIWERADFWTLLIKP